MSKSELDTISHNRNMLMLPPNTLLRGELDIKRSRFIASAKRAVTVDEARAFINTIRNEFPDARHHCSAFSVALPDSPNPTLHSSDDGEPSGTAGRPMLNVITGSGISNICVVVTRYFGGILLGTGGLVRAYSDATQRVLEEAPLMKTRLVHLMAVSLPYAHAGKFEADIRGRGYSVESIEYGARCATIHCVCPPEKLDSFTTDVAELTAGAATPHNEGTTIYELPAPPFAHLNN